MAGWVDFFLLRHGAMGVYVFIAWLMGILSATGFFYVSFPLCIAPDDPSSPPPSFIPTFSFSFLPHYLS